jgi:hypothetical protein
MEVSKSVPRAFVVNPKSVVPWRDPRSAQLFRRRHGRGQQRRGEHGGGGPGLGRHERADAPGRARLGPPRPRLPLRRHRPAVGGPPPDVAVLGAVRRQPVRVGVLLRAPRRRAHLRRRPRHQRRHLRRNGRRRRRPRRARPSRARGARDRSHRPRRMGLHLVANQTRSGSYSILFLSSHAD